MEAHWYTVGRGGLDFVAVIDGGGGPGSRKVNVGGVCSLSTEQ
jgi:hypothetical protein